MRFRTQRRNPTVGTLGRGPSFELPSPPTPACSPVESLRILFSPSFPRPTPPPDGWEPSRETSGFRGAGGAPPWRRPRSPGGASALRTAATSPPAAPAAHRGSPAQTHVGPKQPGRSRPEEAGRVRVSKSSGGTEAVSFWPELDFSAVTQRAASLRSRKTRWVGGSVGREGDLDPAPSARRGFERCLKTRDAPCPDLDLEHLPRCTDPGPLSRRGWPPPGHTAQK